MTGHPGLSYHNWPKLFPGTGVMYRVLLLLFLLAAVAGYLDTAQAQETAQTSPAPDASSPREKVQLSSWVKELRQKENVAILFGNVRVSKGKLSILADAVVVWFKEDGSGVSEIYAEGAILMTDGKNRISAQAAYYSFETGTARITQARVHTTQRSLSDLTVFERSKESGPVAAKKAQPEISLYFRAEKLRTERPTRYVAEKLTLSTCECPHPHWGIRCRRATIYPGGTFEASGNQLFIGPVKIPFFNVRFEPDWRMPLYRLRVGSSSDKGSFRLSRWQLVVEPNYRLFCDLDTYNKNGTGSGAVFEYKGRAYPWGGYLETYAINDREPPAGVKHYRYRLKFLHVQKLPGEVGMTLEYSKTTDQDFLKQFFEREYRKGREQETYAYFRKTHGNLGASLLTSTRTEKFKTVTQHQPQVRAYAISRELPGGFYLSAALRNEKLLRQYAQMLALPDEEVERHDVLLTLDRPLGMGQILRLKPRIDARYTHYNINAADSQNVDREVVKVSCSASTRLSRIYRTSSKRLKIDGLKHIIEPQLTYENTYENDNDPASLFQFDEVDSIRKCEKLTLSLTNRLDTRREVKEVPSVVSLLDWRLQIPYYAKPARDNGGESYGPLESRLEVSASPYLTIRSDLAYDTAHRHMQKGTIDATVRSPGIWQLYLGTLYAAGEDTIGTLGLSARLSPKWSVSVRLQHNLSAGRYVSKTFTLTRRFHCWIMEAGVVLERDKDSPTYVFLISPAALFKKEKLRFTEESTFLK